MVPLRRRPNDGPALRIRSLLGVVLSGWRVYIPRTRYGGNAAMPATIHLGSTGDDVRRLQRALARTLLWNPFGPISGVFDAGLENAVKQFQQDNGLAVDGIVGPATWGKLP